MGSVIAIWVSENLMESVPIGLKQKIPHSCEAEFSIRFYGSLYQYFLLHYHTTFVVEFAFMPECTVGQVLLTGSRTSSQVFGCQFLVCPTLVSTRLGNFSLRMRHDLIYFSSESFFNCLKASQRGSTDSSSELSSSASAVKMISSSNVSSSKYLGCSFFIGMAKATNS